MIDTHALSGYFDSAVDPLPPAPSTRRRTPIVSNDGGILTVKAQMSGVFYRAAAPDQPPLVEVGAAIRKGQTLALLESMKLFSKIKSPVDAAVVEICVGNEETVSVGQVLFRIRRA